MKNLYIKVDSRNRVSLTKVTGKLAPIYRAYTEEMGKIIRNYQASWNLYFKKILNGAYLHAWKTQEISWSVSKRLGLKN